MASVETRHIALSGDRIGGGHQSVSGRADPARFGVQRDLSDHRTVVVFALGCACILAGRTLGARVDG